MMNLMTQYFPSKIHLTAFLLITFFCSLSVACGTKESHQPTIYLIGDSTVKNGQGDGRDGLWGWGDFLHQYIDTTKIKISNDALGGRSSRTYISEGLWDSVKAKIKPGDYVFVQFGHNDSGNINDNHRARGTIKANNEDSVEIDNILTGKHEVVYSFGWYIRKYIRETKELGAIPVACSLTPRNIWEGDSVIRATDGYTQWTKEAAQSSDAYFIDLNDIVATRYEELGEDYVTENLFLEDHTHTNKEGAILCAQGVVQGIKEQQIDGLLPYLID